MKKKNGTKWEILYESSKGRTSSASRAGRASGKSSKSRKSSKGIKSIKEIVDVLLENRGLRTKRQKEEFFNPTHPDKISLKEVGIRKTHLDKALRRIKKAVKENEEIIIYGDYDADGICATAILWETLYSLTNKVRPYIPNRFEDGYGLNVETVEELKKKNPKLNLIITVDNGIVAHEAVEEANKLGIDVIVTDHHQPQKALTSSRGLHPRVGGASLRGKEEYDFPDAYAIVHTTQISGSGVAWILARELIRELKNKRTKEQKNPSTLLRASSKQKNVALHDKDRLLNSSLELCAIGTIADQMSLTGPNRSYAKYGLEKLNATKRPGLLALLKEAGTMSFKGGTLKGERIGTYEVNFVIAPRLNAMGRLEHAIDSLRLLCTKNSKRAEELATILGKTNRKRQKIVDEVVVHAKDVAEKKKWSGAIVLYHETYHEGVIGLAASKLVEEFGRPAIVLSVGKDISKASARSITGFNIIESIKKLENIILGGGGHPMAAGFSIETKKINKFKIEFEKLSSKLLTNEVLSKRIKIDIEIGFGNLSTKLMSEIEKFEPFGIGNYAPVFMTRRTKIVDARTVGTGSKHLKLDLEKNGLTLNAIAFGKGEYYQRLLSADSVDVVYNLARDTWNGNNGLQLKVKDLRLK